jgi:hypothetical protein
MNRAIVVFAAVATVIFYAVQLAQFFDPRVEIKFDAKTDGPIRYEQASAPLRAPSTCLTMMATNGGATGTVVYTPCSVPTSR